MERTPPSSVTVCAFTPSERNRDITVTFTDEMSHFVSDARVYRLLKSRDLITSPAFIVIKAAIDFKGKARAPNQI